ncbi:MAG: ParA family protein [Lachnospiraceae bacterium]|nr:ParA family protein [Lachnospiraceae bacterium]
MATIITVSNQKGGVGKTTTSAALAAGIAATGRRVLGVDLDPQGNLGFCLGLEPSDSPTVLDALLGKVTTAEAVGRTGYCDILPSDISLSSGVEHVATDHKECILKDTLAPIIGLYDYVVIDTPPALNLLTVNAYVVSDFLIIPMGTDIMSLVGLSQLKETIESVQSSLNPNLRVMGILLTRFNKRTLLARDVLEMAGQLANQIGTVVFETKIRNGVAIAEAPAHGESIFEYSPRSSAVKDYQDFLEEIADTIHLKEVKKNGEKDK